MLRDARSLDVIETLLLALADYEQRLAWIDGEDVVTAQDGTTARATGSPPAPDHADPPAPPPA
jgi:hypothetical protein